MTRTHHVPRLKCAKCHGGNAPSVTVKTRQVLDLIRQLAANNGTYCHLLEEYESLNEQMRSVWLKQFEDCRTVFDVVRKLEGW